LLNVFHDRRRAGLGQYPGYALCHPQWQHPGGEDGHLYGYLQLFHYAAADHQRLFGGWIVKHLYNNQPIYAVVLAGFCLIAGAISVLFVYDGGAIRIQQEKAGFYADQQT
jgi:hypothetical protein